MLRASLGKVVHTVKRAGTYAAKVPPQELYKIAVHVRAVGYPPPPTPQPPPPPHDAWIWRLSHVGENVKLSRQAPNPAAQMRHRSGGKIPHFLNNSTTEQYFKMLLSQEDVYSFSSPYCIGKLCSSPFYVPGGGNGASYSEGRAYKRALKLVASPQSTALHHTGNISAEDSVYKNKAGHNSTRGIVSPLLFFLLKYCCTKSTFPTSYVDWGC